MAAALDLATVVTREFVRGELPKPGSRILEVGCGNGRLASALVADGHAVVAIDSNGELVEKARKRGVDARRARFPELPTTASDGRFDAILFTRSLHHIEALDGACRRARALLAPGGVVVVEDWAWEEIDARTAEWAYGTFGVLRAAGLAPQDEFVACADPRADWLRERREHGLHAGRTERDALAKELEILREERAPYFFRYAVRFLMEDPRRDAVASAVLEAARRGIAAGAIVPIGLRLVARAR